MIDIHRHGRSVVSNRYGESKENGRKEGKHERSETVNNLPVRDKKTRAFARPRVRGIYTVGVSSLVRTDTNARKEKGKYINKTRKK